MVTQARVPDVFTAALAAVDQEPSPAEEIAVAVEHVSKTFARLRPFARYRTPDPKAKPPVKAVDDVSFAVRRNEIFGVLGANGSGKSTLIRMMSTLLIPDRGRIEVFGFDVRRDERIVKTLINRVSVEAAFFKKLSPVENLLYSLRLYGRGGGGMRDEIGEILGRLGIAPDRATKPLEQLSRGMQQKVAIARALLTSPVLLLLDEPTTGLDPRSKKDVQGFVHRLRDEHDATIILCSHDMAEAEALCDRIAILDRGRLVALGTVDELKRAVAPALGEPDPSLEDVFIHLTGRDIDEADEEE
jgi:ABC-2 type transport system ATP-binding protein